MITDKIKKIKYKIPTISEVKLVWDSKSDDSIRPNTDQTSCLAALKILKKKFHFSNRCDDNAGIGFEFACFPKTILLLSLIPVVSTQQQRLSH